VDMQILTNFYRQFFWSRPSVENYTNINYFERVPLEIVLEVLSYLPSHTLIALGKTCRTFRQLTQDYTLDIAKRILFQKMRTERISVLNSDWADFIYSPRGIVEFDGSEKDLMLKLTDLKNNQQTNLLDCPVFVCDQLDDYCFVIYKKDFIAVKFLHINTLSWTAPINISELIDDKNNNNHPCRYTKDTDKLILHVNNHLFVIRKGAVILHLFAHNLKISHFEASGDSLVLHGVEKKGDVRTKEYRQYRYSIHEQKILASRTFCKSLPFSRIFRVFATSQYIVTIAGLNEVNPFIVINVCDLNFQWVSNYTIGLTPQIFDEAKGRHTYGTSPYMHCYENRLVIFINYNTLIFVDLTQGKEIKQYFLDTLENTNDYRVCCRNENVMLMRKKSIELYDIKTGHFLHRFVTAARPQCMIFASPYQFYFTYKTRNDEVYSARLRLKDEGVVQKGRKRARRK
jgi:hypothetical protein